jgi:PKD repeat protein
VISCTTTGGPEQSTTQNPVSLTFTGAGSHTIVYRARDNVGNTSATKSITVVVDSVKPNVSYNGAATRTVTPAGGDSDVGPTILTGTASDNVGVTSVSVRIFSAGDSDVGFSHTYAASCPSCAPGATSVNWSLNLSTLSPAPTPGVYNTEIIARDQAGNVRRIAGPTLTF